MGKNLKPERCYPGEDRGMLLVSELPLLSPGEALDHITDVIEIASRDADIVEPGDRTEGDKKSDKGRIGEAKKLARKPVQTPQRRLYLALPPGLDEPRPLDYLSFDIRHENQPALRTDVWPR